MTKISSTLITACVAFATLSSGLPHKNQPRQNEVLDPSFSAPKFNLTAIESFVGDIERPPTVDPDPQAPPAKPTKSTPFNFSDRRHNKRDDWQYSCWKKQSGSLSLAWASAYTWAANQTLYEQGNCELPSDKKCVDCKCATNAAIQLCRGNEQTTNAISVPNMRAGLVVDLGASVRTGIFTLVLLPNAPFSSRGCWGTF
ncbi:hypothetical protein Dda_0612 [Drechslerella dactyloides]|uniref:Uncharacterized protein n=1 Tax=Drechslerella dactyloides TaxID=74499 RepID=A0AAD6J809_DREDA|nr:hypothetical protein Dda_0612 [Drechslerella dactyloides]